MGESICLNSEYSTTRHVTHTPPNAQDTPDGKYKSMLSLPAHPGRKGEGGLRMQGYFKTRGCLDVGINSTDGGVAVKRNPLITVITVVLNGAETLEETILSVIGQSYDNIEYIIVDGGSTDDSLDIVRKYEHAIDYWVSESDDGIYDAMNKGVSLSQGDLVGIINSDDYYLPLAIESVVNCYIEKGEGVFHGDMLVIDKAHGKKWSKRPSTDPSSDYLRDMPVNHPSMFVSYSLYNRFGAFSSEYRLSADYEFVCRLLASNVKFYYLGTELAGFREEGRSGGYLTFSESRSIQIKYGRSRITASLGFCWSMLKAGIAPRIPASLLRGIRLVKGSKYVESRAAK